MSNPTSSTKGEVKDWKKEFRDKFTDEHGCLRHDINPVMDDEIIPWIDSLLAKERQEIIEEIEDKMVFICNNNSTKIKAFQKLREYLWSIPTPKPSVEEGGQDE